jgi:membrane protease YdiL (CAAX protease family)
MDNTTLLLVASEWIGVIALGMLVGLSPAVQKIKPLQFLFPRREASVTFSLNAALFIFSIIVYKYFFTAVGEITTFNLEAGIQRIILDVIGLAVVAAAIVYRKQPFRSALWGKEGLRSNLTLGLLLVALTLFLRSKIIAITNGVSSTEGLALIELFVIALCEVTIFFGYSQPRFSSRFGPTAGWLISAGLFTLWQVIPLALHGGTWQTSIYQVGLAVGEGLILGFITSKSKHALAPAIYLALSQWLFLIQ